MTKIIKLYDAKTHLSDLVERASRGEEFIIAKGDEPKARLIPITRHARARAPGGWEGRVSMHPFPEKSPRRSRAANE